MKGTKISSSFSPFLIDEYPILAIVATSLDGQQPESKSVVNMVHRIQNRNPGYSDFSNMGSSQSFNFSNTTRSNPFTQGANALKLENEIIQEQQTESPHNQMMNEEVVQNTSMESESIVEDNSVNEMEKSFAQEAMENTHEETLESNVDNEASKYLTLLVSTGLFCILSNFSKSRSTLCTF